MTTYRELLKHAFQQEMILVAMEHEAKYALCEDQSQYDKFDDEYLMAKEALREQYKKSLAEADALGI